MLFLKYNYFVLSPISSALNYAITLYLAYSLGIEQYGAFAYVLTLVMTVAQLSDLGFSPFYISRSIDKYLSPTSYVIARLAVVSIPLLIIKIYFDYHTDFLSLLLLSYTLIASNIISNTLDRLSAIHHMGIVNLALSISRLIILIFYSSGDGLHSYTTIIDIYSLSFIAQCLVGVFVIFHIKPKNLRPAGNLEISILSMMILFLIQIFIGRFDVIIFYISETLDEELKNYYFYLLGLIFPVNQFVLMLSRYTFVIFYDVVDERFFNILKRATWANCSIAIVTIISYLLFEHYLHISVFLIIALCLSVFFSITTGILSRAIYDSKGGVPYKIQTVMQFFVTIIILFCSTLNAELALLVGIIFINFIGTMNSLLQTWRLINNG